MKAKYEYKFVRLGEGWLEVIKGTKSQYQQVTHDHARDGWRLVQVFYPSIGAFGIIKFYELIFERELSQ